MYVNKLCRNSILNAYFFVVCFENNSVKNENKIHVNVTGRHSHVNYRYQLICIDLVYRIV